MDLDALERLADARWVALILSMIGNVAMAWACYRLYRDKCGAENRLRQMSEKTGELTERIYERYVEDLRGRAGHDVATPASSLPGEADAPDP